MLGNSHTKCLRIITDGNPLISYSCRTFWRNTKIAGELGLARLLPIYGNRSSPVSVELYPASYDGYKVSLN